MFEKIWDDHVVRAEGGKQTILYIDLQLVHEVTSAQAFEGRGSRPMWRQATSTSEPPWRHDSSTTSAMARLTEPSERMLASSRYKDIVGSLLMRLLELPL